MQDEPNRDVAAGSERLQRVVLELLLAEQSPGLWSVDEVGLAVGDEIAVGDAIAELHAYGLVQFCGSLVCPSRAAVRFEQLSQQGVL